MLRRLCALLAVACASCATTGTLEPPKVTVTDITLDYFTAPDARFTVKVKVDNPNPRELAVDAVRAELRLEDISVGTAALATPLRVPARGEVTASVAAAADLMASLRASAEIARRLSQDRQATPTVHYAVVGTVTLANGGAIPFSRAGEFKLALTAPTR
jgi:LEA14-like dessication related protein